MPTFDLLGLLKLLGKAALFGIFLGAFLGATLSFALLLDGLASNFLVDLPDASENAAMYWLHAGLGLLPGNFAACLSALFTAYAGAWAYSFYRYTLALYSKI